MTQAAAILAASFALIGDALALTAIILYMRLTNKWPKKPKK